MICPACGLMSEVRKTLTDKVVTRRRECRCGARWTSEERIRRGTLVVGPAPAVATGAPPVATNSPVISSDPDQVPPEKRKEPGHMRPPVATNSHPKSPKYPERFEECWKLYGQKKEKDQALAQWKITAKAEGGEDALRDLIVAALKWQGPAWAADGWKFSPYFHRYLKRRRWTDEPAPATAAPVTPIRSADPPWVAAQREEEARKRREAAETAAARERFEALERGAG